MCHQSISTGSCAWAATGATSAAATSVRREQRGPASGRLHRFSSCHDVSGTISEDGPDARPGQGSTVIGLRPDDCLEALPAQTTGPSRSTHGTDCVADSYHSCKRLQVPFGALSSGRGRTTTRRRGRGSGEGPVARSAAPGVRRWRTSPARAGVSVASVSRVINDHPHVTAGHPASGRGRHGATWGTSPTPRPARSRAAGRRSSACSPRRSRTRSRTASSAASTRPSPQLGYDFLLCTTHARREKEAEYVARLSRGMVDGLLIILPRGLPDYVGELRAASFPFVLIDYDADAPGCSVVNATNRQGARAAIRHLLDAGPPAHRVHHGPPERGRHHGAPGRLPGGARGGGRVGARGGHRGGRLPGAARPRCGAGAVASPGCAHGGLRVQRLGGVRRAAGRPRAGPQGAP